MNVIEKHDDLCIIDARWVARGHASFLIGAFVWSETPQGHEYWSDCYASGSIPMDGIRYVKKRIREFEKRL